MPQQDLFKIRDKRNKGWFFMDNEYLNGYAKIFGAIGTAIYVSLCRHADQDQKCFPSEKLIAEELAITDRVIRKYLKKFEEYNLLKVERNIDPISKKRLNNTYYLLDKSEWKPKPEERSSYGKPEERSSKNQRNVVPIKDTHIKNTNKNILFFRRQRARMYFGCPQVFSQGAWRDLDPKYEKELKETL